MNGRRWSRADLACLLLLLLTSSCSTSSFPEIAVSSGQSPTPTPFLGSSSPTPLSLPGRCAVQAVVKRLDALARDVSRGDGQAVAAHFLAGPELRWEVYDHADAPNGTLGALRTLDAIAAVVRDIHARGEVWVSDEVVPPTHRDNGSPAVYAYGISITSGDTTTDDGTKVVIDCATGRVTHMVGPGT